MCCVLAAVCEALCLRALVSPDERVGARGAGGGPAASEGALHVC